MLAVNYGQWFDYNHYLRDEVTLHYDDEYLGYGSLEPIYRRDGVSVDSIDELADTYDRLWVIRNRWDEWQTNHVRWTQVEGIVIDGKEAYIHLYEQR